MAARVLLQSLIFATALRKDRKKRKAEIERKTYKSGKFSCRVCNETKASVPIFENEWQRNIAEEIECFSGVAILQQDTLPHHICPACLDLLDSCILFRKTCQRTQELFNAPLEHVHLDENNDYFDKHEPEPHYNDFIDAASPSDGFNVKAHSEEEKWQCAECFHEYADKTSFNWHLPFCEGKQPKKVQVKKEASKKRLKGEKGVKDMSCLCDTCGKTFNNKHVLAQHMLTHSNVFPYKCDVCPYRGRTVDLLRTHKRIHLADKPYKCEMCPKTTTTASNLRRHIMTRHATGNTVKCTYCEKSFTNNLGLKKHVTNMHLRQAGSYECDICYRKYSTQKMLRRHRYRVHKVTPALMGRLPSYLACQMEEERDHPMMDPHLGED